jgi:AraC-like DNA-binding protein
MVASASVGRLEFRFDVTVSRRQVKEALLDVIWRRIPLPVSIRAMSESVRYHRFPLPGIDPMSANTTRSFPRHTHDQYGIGVIDSGGHASWSGRGQVEAGHGQFISVNPGEVHDGRAIGDHGRSWRILYFEPASLDEICTDVLEHLSATWMFDAPVFADGPLREKFESAFGYAAGAAQIDPMGCETAIIDLVAGLGSHATVARRPQGGAPRIHQARARMDDDPAAPLTLAQLACDSGLSRYQLIRGFTREFGLPPHAYLLQRRLALARRLIRAGRALAEVAVAAGFHDQSHLTRCFTRQFGVAPKRYASRLP